MWAPYDSQIYQLVLEQLSAGDIVLEIGAGDLRLSREIARRTKRVYAIEQNETLLERYSRRLPTNIHLIAGDARYTPFPNGITMAVLLMRHCTHFALYFDKLQSGTCSKLITNARWGMNVETIDLEARRPSYRSLDIGWFACRCGQRGFKPGPPQEITEVIENRIWEVGSCPSCGGLH